jgi:hypothetical protein
MPVHRQVPKQDANGSGFGCYKGKCAHHFYLLEREAPIARLMPTGKGDAVRLGYWPHRREWDDPDDFGGIVMPLDDALAFVGKENILWIWN